MTAWEFIARTVVTEDATDSDGAPPEHFRVDVEDGDQPLEVHRNRSLASGLPGAHEYEVVFVRRADST